MNTPRKHTRFEFCPEHSAHFAGMTRARRAEWVAEGGPGTPCAGDGCKVYAGTDFFIPEVCHGEYVSQFGGWTDWQRAG